MEIYIISVLMYILVYLIHVCIYVCVYIISVLMCMHLYSRTVLQGPEKDWGRGGGEDEGRDRAEEASQRPDHADGPEDVAECRDRSRQDSLVQRKGVYY